MADNDSAPVQPSPACPPAAEHWEAWVEFQVRVTSSPISRCVWLAVSEIVGGMNGFGASLGPMNVILTSRMPMLLQLNRYVTVPGIGREICALPEPDHPPLQSLTVVSADAEQ